MNGHSEAEGVKTAPGQPKPDESGFQDRGGDRTWIWYKIIQRLIF
jgi:hypothetical protein